MAMYVKKFEEIGRQCQDLQELLSSAEHLKIQIEELKEQNMKINEIKANIDEFKNSVPLYSIECKELQALVRKVGIKALGGYKTPAYNNKSLRSKIYSDIQHQLRREFDVERYEAIKRCEFEIAKKIIEEYKPPTFLVNQITLLNSEISFDLEVI
ncbi:MULTISPECIES: ORF6C domain-containing protein [unclassified Clostridium]|uniref:ORF6C domain-containing protein n=1 Tax=unclassified Clostridium TaxID=2614128 RepID=UPI00029814A6|nr:MULTISPECIES: ORF6C domain-containing protein [unclassified Clostridium]EKQ58318.1 MAG: ORF6C domain containing protein [Clostridium sp. Maddingley MBC34-26]